MILTLNFLKLDSEEVIGFYPLLLIICEKKIFCNENEDSIKIYKSFFKHVKSIETEMNLDIELMRLIRDYAEIPENCVSKKARKDFRSRVNHILQG